MNLGSIRDVMDVLERGITEQEVIEITKTTLVGLIYLHQQMKIIHRDVKAANILVNIKSEVKIADFGVANVVGKSNELCGSPYW